MKALNVLVVDDDPSIRSLLRIALSLEEGVAEVREADGGEDALRVCLDFTPDLVFLDFWMPFLDGAAVAARIKRLHPHVHIVAFSGVLDTKPDWADDLYVKGDLPDLELVIDLVRAEAG
jgi:two-component system competent response regulator ComA